MKKILVAAAIVLISFTESFCQNPDGVRGTWMNDEKDVKIEIYKSGDRYFGKIVWTKNMYESDGKTLKKDGNNSDEKLRGRTILNMVVLSGFYFDDGEWTG